MRWRWLGTVPYGEALPAQRAHRDALVEGRAEEELWLLEHPPVVTTGRRSVADLDPERIAAAGYALFATERGGLATCHEPGQLVGYLFADIRAIGVRRAVELLEGAIAGWLRELGLPAGPREGYPGVWLGRDKVCAVGLHVRAGRTMHGFALNIRNDLRGFGLVTPCGIVDGGVTSLARQGLDWTPEGAAAPVGAHVVAAFASEGLDALAEPVNRGGTEGT